ncbi:MAG: amino acid permease [Halobacteriaceae archaeon]
MVEHTRSLDFKVAFAIGLGTMIAAGIFSLSGTAVYRIGSSAVAAFVLAALVAAITAATYSEFASIYSENGGGYLFASRTVGERDLLVYGIGASLFLGYTGTTAFYLATMDEWFVRFVLPPAAQGLPRGSVGVVAAVALGVLNARGTEESGVFQLVVTGAKVAVLFAFVAGAIAYAGPARSASTFLGNVQVEPVGIVSVAALAFITFFGFSAIAASAGEIIEPRKTVPRAIAASMVTVTVLYTLVIVAMVNAPVSREVLAAGETAMGEVAASFLGPAGQALIVAGAVFSMVSASNASILAASGIGSLMGRQGHGPRRFDRVHPEYGTPFWSVAAAAGTIVALVVVFITLFSEHGLTGLPALGLNSLTGFATFNLLVPLAVVNLALIYSRRRFPEVERGFRVPGVPAVPLLGVVANVGLVANLPQRGVFLGFAVTGASLAAYAAWGGAPDVDELVERVVEPRASAGGAASAGTADGRTRALVPVARPQRAPRYVRLAATLAAGFDGDPVVQVLNVTEIPDQTPNELVRETAAERADRVEAALAAADLDVDYTVEGHVCRDVAFDVVQTARDDGADLVVMGYPENNPSITETVAFQSPCGVFFASGVTDDVDLSVLTVGVGGGPHHAALLPVVDALGARGAAVHLVNVAPAGREGTGESLTETVDALPTVETASVHRVTAENVATGLVEVAASTGGVLLIGASRDRRLKQWLLGSTPDRTVRLAAAADVPVLVYARPTGVHGVLAEVLFTGYRIVRRWIGLHGRAPEADGDASPTAE